MSFQLTEGPPGRLQ